MIFGESVLGKLAMTFFMAMVPVVELRGAIPLGVAAGLPPAVAAVTAMAGNLTPVPCILLLRRVFALMRKSAWLGPKVDRLERRAHLKGRKVRKYRTLGLVLLVAIPLPGTGAWTGALVADVLDIRMRTALPAIAAGVIIAGCITTAVTCGVAGLMGGAAQRANYRDLLLLKIDHDKEESSSGDGRRFFFCGGMGRRAFGKRFPRRGVFFALLWGYRV